MKFQSGLLGLNFSEEINPIYRAFAELEGFELKGLRYKSTKLDPRIRDRYSLSVQEYFAEMFAISKLRPELLTQQELIFFGNLHRGLAKKGLDYLKSVAGTPDILFNR